MIIGLTGLAGAGKSVIADVLIREFGFERVKFADPLKNMLRRMLGDMGHIAEDVERMLEGDLKEVPIPELGVTPRHLMITLGTEWGRDLVRQDLWIQLWAASAERFPRVVADDVRFPNEVDTIRAQGGVIWRIDRPGLVRERPYQRATAGHARRHVRQRPHP
jgi:cytidylate kinase